jgi:hypothetical protein
MPFLSSSYSPESLRISSSAPWLVFLAMSSSRERRVLPRRLQLGEARLPLAHLVLLELQELLVLPVRALVVRQAASVGVDGRAGLVAFRFDLLEPCRVLLGLEREIADLEIDLLQLLQFPQLVARHVSSLVAPTTLRPGRPGGQRLCTSERRSVNAPDAG